MNFLLLNECKNNFDKHGEERIKDYRKMLGQL